MATLKIEGPKSPRNAAYAEAARQLRQAHVEEFNRLYEAACEKHGVEWKPRMSAAERAARDAEAAKAKAAAQVSALLEKFGQDILPSAPVVENPAFTDPAF